MVIGTSKFHYDDDDDKQVKVNLHRSIIIIII